jgi:large subunit ribosomal protein L25
MSEFIELAVVPRERIAKASRKLAHLGQVPAVLYGVGHTSEALTIDRHELERLLAHDGVRSLVLHVKIEGRKTPVNAMVKAIQMEPVKGTPMHVDLLAVQMNVAVNTAVALHFVNESPGVKAGGILNANHNQVNVEALPGNIPEGIEVDISSLEVGDSLTFGDLVIPDGVTVTDDVEELVVSVTAPKVEVEEAVTEEVAPEVVGEQPAESTEE